MEKNNPLTHAETTWNTFHEKEDKTGQFTPFRIWKNFCEEFPDISNHEALKKIKNNLENPQKNRNRTQQEFLASEQNTQNNTKLVLDNFEEFAKKAGFNQRHRSEIKKMLISHNKIELINFLKKEKIIRLYKKKYYVIQSIYNREMPGQINRNRLKFLQKTFSNSFTLESNNQITFD